MSALATVRSFRWVAVWRRNYLVWKKLAAESVLGNIVEPLFYLVGFGLGFGTMLPEVEGVKYIAYLAGGTICYSTMLSASFETLYSGFARMHVQRTWEGILNAPVSLEMSCSPSGCGPRRRASSRAWRCCSSRSRSASRNPGR
jgi:Nod factor-specific ABC transporter NodJ protein